MKKMKFMILLLAAVMVMAPLTACESPASRGSEGSSAVESTATDISTESLAASDASTESSVAPKRELPPKVTLSGNHDDHLITDKLCYIEGDKFFLLLDDGVDLPGDFADNISLIMDAIEKETGLTFAIDKSIHAFDNGTYKYGYNPWESLEFGQKVPIFICVDKEDAGYISCADAMYATIYDHALFSMDVWNSVPDYRDNPWRRLDYVEYYSIAHELTHVLTCRHACISKILTEGSADYVAERVINSFASVSDDFEGNVEYMSYNLFHHVEENVTSKNAEEIFRKDYRDLSHADRGDEYTLGRMMFTFLSETYGDTCLHDYLLAAAEAGFAYPESYLSYHGLKDEEVEKLVDVFKQTFGDDVFKNFGTYYQKHKTNN